MTVTDEIQKVEAKEKEEKKKEEKKIKAKDRKGEPQGRMVFRGGGLQMFLYFLLFPITGLILFIPVPFVSAALRDWIYKSLDIEVEGKKIDVSFTGRGAQLLKFWIPTLLLIITAIVLFSFGLSTTVQGTKGFLVGFSLTLLGLLALVPIPWLCVGKRKYIAENTRVNLGGEGKENIARIAFNGKGASLLGYSVLFLLSPLLLFIPLPWIIVAAVKWLANSTTVTVGKEEYRPSFSGSGGSLLWYIFGMIIASILLIFPFAFKSTVSWFARYLNIIGLERTVEFEFKGGPGKIYLLSILELFFIFVGSVLGNTIYILGKSGIITALWAVYAIKASGILLMLFIILIPQPFIMTSFLKWQIDNTEIFIMD